MGLLLLGGKKFNPRQISNLQLWFDATKITSADATKISSWSDLSGNQYDAAQATSGSQPTYNLNKQNGLPCVTFDGSTSFMSITSGLGITANIAGASTFVALKHNTTGAVNRVVFNIATASGTTNRVNIAKNTANKFSTVTRRTDTTGNITNASTRTVVANEFVIHNVINNYLGGTIFQYLDNTQDPSSSNNYAASGNTTNSNSGFMYIGCDNDTPTIDFFSGDIGEIIFYNKALSDAERTSVHLYLKRKWGI